MSSIKRILLNTCASYGRTLFGMFLGLFSARWVLNGLGEVDYGLFGVVGGIVVFVGLLNALLASSVARYYAFAIGESKLLREDDAVDHLCKWFNSALLIHWILPIVLIVVGYPIGVYAIEHWLNIPDNRIVSSLWVFRMSLLLAFFNMISVPYIAMYQAKQLIAELSIWGIITTMANFFIAYYILRCPYDRFIVYSFLSVIAPSFILCIQVYRARKHFLSCRLKVDYLFDVGRLRKIFSFAFWDFFGWLGASVRDQGGLLVTNRSFGASASAAYRVAQSVITYTTSLSGAITTSMQPAITTAVGQHNLEDARELSYKTSKFSALMILFFAIPLIVEVDFVLKLWLINPPQYAAEFCQSILVATVLLKLGWGHHIAICAMGRIAAVQIILGITAACSLGILIVLIWLGVGAISIGYSLILTFFLMTIERILFAKKLVQMSVRYWFVKILVPIGFSSMLTLVVIKGFSMMFSQSFLRVLGSSFLSVCVFSSLSWFVVLTSKERDFVKKNITSRMKKVFG